MLNETKDANVYPKDKIMKDMTKIALFSAIMCILGPLSLQIGPIPISFTNLVIYFALYIMGMKKGTISYLIYMLLGLVGLPVFSGFQGGPAKLFGNTGGYIFGFIFLALISGFFIDKWPEKLWLHFIALVAGTAVCYGLGTIWYIILAKCTLETALTFCVIPFIPGDFIKIVLAMVAGPQIRKRLIRANLF